MEWLNYHHLLYFWVVARNGSIAAACEELRLRQPTISMQLKMLEKSLGVTLFERRGRALVLTEAGNVVYRYAEQIFRLGEELLDVIRGYPAAHAPVFRIGIVDVIPKLVAYHLVSSVLRVEPRSRIICREDHTDRLLAGLALHELDAIVTDMPLGAGSGVRAYTHPLGESEIAFLAKASVAAKYRRRFPKSLDAAPFLLPTEHTNLRRALDLWFTKLEIRPHVIAEFDDSALLKIFGQAGEGIFPAPAAIVPEIRRQYGVTVIGRTAEITERFYVISPERKITHPAMRALLAQAYRIF